MILEFLDQLRAYSNIALGDMEEEEEEEEGEAEQEEEMEEEEELTVPLHEPTSYQCT